jgi:hypothetical protein
MTRSHENLNAIVTSVGLIKRLEKHQNALRRSPRLQNSAPGSRQLKPT